jgi:alpha-tubulin suppressor-like RCC1 family protein
MQTTVARGLLATAVAAALTFPVASSAAFASAGAATDSPRPQAAAAPAQGPLLAWGEDDDGQLGDGSMMIEYGAIAVNAPSGLRATQARAGSFAVAVNSAGQVYAWGRGNQGELGNGSFTSRSRPVKVHLPKGVKVTSARAGFEFAIALTSAGKVLTWGAGGSGDLGNGRRANHDRPVSVRLPRGVKITAVTAGADFAAALTAAGRVLTWGDNFVGELGDGKKASTATPVYARLPRGTKIKAIAAGTDRVFAITSAGALLAWGGNDQGSLGIGGPGIRRTPVRVHLPRGVTVVSASGGLLHSLALTTTGKVLAWGDNEAGQLGDGTLTRRLAPVFVHLPKSAHIVAIAAGRYHSLALTRGGKILAWGYGGVGALGTGTQGDHKVPVQIMVPGVVIAIGAGPESYSSYAVVKKIID